MKINEQPSKQQDKSLEEVETFEGESIDPHLLELRQRAAKEEDAKKNNFELETGKYTDAVQKTREAITSLMEKDSTLGTKKDAYPRESKIIYQKPSQKKSFFKNTAAAIGFTIAGLFGMGKDAKATSPDDSLQKEKKVAAVKGVENKEIRQLSQREMQEWNMFVDFVEEKGYQGAKELDVKGAKLAQKLFDEFKKLNPHVKIDLSITASVQAAMQGVKEMAQGFAKRKGDQNANNIMAGISKVDGWPGSKTTAYKFPGLEEQTYHNDALQSKTDKGLIDGKGLQSKTKIPKGAEVMELADGKYYQDPDSGDLVKIK